MDFFEALQCVKGLNLEWVIIEGDVKVIVDAINSTPNSRSLVFGDFIGACKNVLSSLSFGSVYFVKRSVIV